MRKFITKPWVFINFIFSIIILLLIYIILFQPNINLKDNNKKIIRINIYPYHTKVQLFKTLQKKQILNSLYTLKIASFILRYNNVYQGSYCLMHQMNNFQIIRILRGGLQTPVKLIIHNIQNKEMLAECISKYLMLSKDDFMTLLNDNQYLKSYDFNDKNIVAMFIPNTYNIYWNISANKLFQKFHNEYNKFWTIDRINKCKFLRLSKIEVSTLASIVQAETKKIFEASIIAGVYYNRLKRKMRLQADPTLKFAIKNDKAMRILNVYKHVKSPYNTYKNHGLPPGPINIPSVFMIDAVLNLTKHKYLYMAAKEDFSGEHYFSELYRTHVNHAIRYRKALNKYKIFK